MPLNTGPCHSVEDGQQFPCARSESHLLRLACFQQSLEEVAQHRVAPTGHQCAHIQRGAYRSSTAPRGTLAPMRAAVTIEGRYTEHTGD